MKRAFPGIATLLSSASELAFEAGHFCSGLILVVFWITAECDLHHNFRVKGNYSGTTPRSASRAQRVRKKLYL
jgi:hypothetical protein